MIPLALAVLLSLPAAAEPPQNHCKAWNGSHTRLPYRDCGGVPEAALRYAQACMSAFGGQLGSRKIVVFGDWTVSGEFTRLHVLEWDQNDPYKSFTLMRGGLAHGSGNGAPEDGGTPPETRDQWNSYATPGGCMRLFGTGEAGQMTTAPDMKAYKLDGLEDRNSCVLERGLYFHEYGGRVEQRRTDGAAPQDVKFGDLAPGNFTNGFSNGCVSLNPEDFEFIRRSKFVPRTGGVLFVSWDGNGGYPKPRAGAAPRNCRSPIQGVVRPVKPTPNIYEKIMFENIMEKVNKQTP